MKKRIISLVLLGSIVSQQGIAASGALKINANVPKVALNTQVNSSMLATIATYAKNFYNNKTAFYSTIGGVATIATIALTAILWSKSKKNGKKDGKKPKGQPQPQPKPAKVEESEEEKAQPLKEEEKEQPKNNLKISQILAQTKELNVDCKFEEAKKETAKESVKEIKDTLQQIDELICEKQKAITIAEFDENLIKMFENKIALRSNRETNHPSTLRKVGNFLYPGFGRRADQLLNKEADEINKKMEKLEKEEEPYIKNIKKLKEELDNLETSRETLAKLAKSILTKNYLMEKTFLDKLSNFAKKTYDLSLDKIKEITSNVSKEYKKYKESKTYN